MEIKKVCILGAGIMGSGIAQIAAQAGFDIVIRDIEERFVENGLKTVRKNLNYLVSKGKITSDDAEAILGRITGTTDLNSAVSDADLIIEAVVELMAIKKEVYKELDAICGDDTIFASNTSALSITEMASVTGRAEKFIGLHFFNPVPVMKLVEIIRGFSTSDETFQAVKGFVEKVNKTPVEITESPGFSVNRILCPMINEAIFAYSEGVASAEDIDTSMVLGANHPIGPLALADMIGLDTLLNIMDELLREMGDSKYRAAPLLRKMVRAGHLGRKTSGGFYEYK